MDTIDKELDLLIFNQRFVGLRFENEKREYLRCHRIILKEQLEKGTYFAKELQDVYDKAKAITQAGEKNQYYFITICPYEDTSILSLIKVMDKVLKKKWITKYLYVYEQRQDQYDKPFFGIHTHIIVERTGIAKSDVIREVFNTAKSICGSKQSIDVKLLKTRRDLLVHINYILGTKSTSDKQKKQIIDKIFREKNNLKSHYLLGEWQEDIIASLKTDISLESTKE